VVWIHGSLQLATGDAMQATSASTQRLPGKASMKLIKTLFAMLILLTVPMAQAKGEVAFSKQTCAPDGFITITDYSSTVKRVNGLFMYCTKGARSIKECAQWGTAQQAIESELERTDVKYVGLGVDQWHDRLFLFYCINNSN
jgi:hypothetical protein